MQWAQSRPPDLPDDFSLVSQAGPVINHATATQFIEGLNSFQPDLRVATPNLQSLAIALDTVRAQTPRLGMKRAILFITPHMDDPNLAAVMDPLLKRAVGGGIRIFIWFVDFDSTFNTTSAAVFNALAVRNTAKYSPPMMARPAEARHDWEILNELTWRLAGGGVVNRVRARSRARLQR